MKILFFILAILILSNLCLSKKKNLDPNTLVFKSSLGEGGFGDVYLVEYPIGNNNDLKALKVMKDKMENQNDLNFSVELNKENKNKYFPEIYATGKQNIYIYILMKYYVMDLKKLIQQEYFETNLWLYIKKIAEILEYLENKKIIHSDIKPDNFLINHDGNIVLTDFSITHRCEDSKEELCLTKGSSSSKGTDEIRSPEVIKGEMHGTNADIWSFGTVIFEMCTKKEFSDIFYSKDLSMDNEQYLNNTEDYGKSIFEEIAKQKIELKANCRDLLKIIFVEQPKRASAKQILEFLEGIKDIEIPKIFSTDLTEIQKYNNRSDLKNFTKEISEKTKNQFFGEIMKKRKRKNKLK